MNRTPLSPSQMENEDVDQQMENENEDRRIVLTIQGGSFNPSNNVTSIITSIWKSRFTGAWDTWKIVPEEDKEIWFKSFKEKYTWDAGINQKVRNLFNYLGSRSLRDFMTRVRIKGRAQKPPFMNQAIWDGLWIIWESPGFIAKSERGRAARQSNKRLHVAGSISIAEHRRRLQKELGRDPTAAELFFRTHMKKDKSFVDNEAKETWEQYMAKYGAEDSLDMQSGNIANTYIRWAEHVGSKKGKFYGLPSGFDRYIFEHIVDSIGQTAQHHEIAQLREMLDCQKIENDLLKAEQERMKETQEAHSEKLDQIVKSQNLLEGNLKVIQSATQKVLDLLQRRQPAV